MMEGRQKQVKFACSVVDPDPGLFGQDPDPGLFGKQDRDL